MVRGTFNYIQHSLTIKKTMSLLPSTNDSAVGIHYFAQDLPAGVATGLTWTQLGTSGYYFGKIKNVSAQLTGTSALSVSLQTATSADANTAWIMNASPSTDDNGTITVLVNALPSTPAVFGVSWAVVKY
jgi:hypothetical protein